VKLRWLGILVALVLVEGAFFFVRHREVVHLSRSTGALTSDATFTITARAVLGREQVSRRVLERIADVAGRRHDDALQLAALDRIAVRAPMDHAVQLRRADVLRSMGRLAEAEALYARAAEPVPGVEP
jgi:hypothetical protein